MMNGRDGFRYCIDDVLHISDIYTIFYYIISHDFVMGVR